MLCNMLSAVGQAKWDSVLESPAKKTIQLVKSAFPFLLVLTSITKIKEKKKKKTANLQNTFQETVTISKMKKKKGK